MYALFSVMIFTQKVAHENIPNYTFNHITLFSTSGSRYVKTPKIWDVIGINGIYEMKKTLT